MNKQSGARVWRLSLWLAATAIAAVLVLAPRPAAACSCLPPSIESSYNTADVVVAARPLLSFRYRSRRWSLTRVRKTFKGCPDAGEYLWVSTPASSAACGAQLERGVMTLLNGVRQRRFLGLQHIMVNLCGYNVPTSDLSEHDREFLNGRSVCCGERCECADGSDPVACFANPCDVTPACQEASECVANYCGGCNAEFYDDFGQAVCQQPGCERDTDCPEAQWCREAEPALESGALSSTLTVAQRECVPFVGEGESCNGFTLPWFFERCQPGLTCDTPNFIADAPGVCRANCDTNDDCGDGQYCAADGLCDDDGSCEVSADCNLPGNDYPHIECVGYGVCPEFEGQCGYECGHPQCVDLYGYDYPDECDAVLGWAVVQGECREISGCSIEPFELFPSEADCREACLPGPSCRDLGATDFGDCAQPLGVAVSGGVCRPMSGCNAPVTLFESVDECQAECNTGCYSDGDCGAGLRCNATEVCLPPPGCTPGRPCPAVCFGQCVEETECVPGDTTPPDECGNVCSCTASGQWVCTLRPCVQECTSDEDCQSTGCSGQLCAPHPLLSTCEWRPEYACYQDADVTTCGCNDGRCAWADTAALSECLTGAQ